MSHTGNNDHYSVKGSDALTNDESLIRDSPTVVFIQIAFFTSFSLYFLMTESSSGEVERIPKSSKDSPSGEPQSIGEGVAQRDSGVGIDGVTIKETHVTLDESDAEALRKLRLNPDGEDVLFISEFKTPKKSRQTTSSGAKNPLPIDEFDISNVEYSEELTEDDLARKLKREAEMAELLALRKRSKNRIDYLLFP
ncbi:hypothetical protein GEMRC1_013782 [Eukaryota sp. GEM-RC1]